MALAFVKRFEAEEPQRSRWNLSGGLRLVPNMHFITLPEGQLEATAATWVTTMHGASQWLAFQADVTHRTSPEGGAELVTTARFRVSTDGAAWHGWDGVAWTLGGPWNKPEEISEHLATWPVGPIAFQVKLATTDLAVTPLLHCIKLAVELQPQYNSLDDMIWRSLLRQARTSVRPIGRIDLKWPGGTEGTFSAREQDYRNIVGISAFDIGADATIVDPDEDQNLLASYDDNTKTITLSGAVAAGRFVRFYFRYSPLFAAVSTSIDYVEGTRAPSITFTNVRAERSGTLLADSAVNHHSGIGITVPAQPLKDLSFDIEISAGREYDMAQVQQAIGEWLVDGAKVRSRALDEIFDLQVVSHYSPKGFPDIRGLHRGSLRAEILSAVVLDRGASPAYGVKTATISGSVQAEF